ncbi:MAG: CocE/NonD family hydrolase [Phycisphaerae bacterium]|nr:CocE/NonD family hydrolase [Phycisphaerae bacterium]
MTAPLRSHLSPRFLDRARLCLLSSVPLLAVIGCAAPKTGGDAAWYDQKQIETKFPARYQGVTRTGQYVTMRDGCKIAIDVYLPKGLEPDERMPAIVEQTRYWRSIAYQFPFNLLAGPEPSDLAKFFIARGYAWIAVDARGSGASFGTRPCCWSIDEIKDGADLVDWIIRQSWSDGTVGTTGISYNGTTAEFLAVNKHPAVKAAAPLFSLFDVYTDIAYPGGIHLTWFTKGWGKLNRQLDENTIPDLAYEFEGPLVGLVLKGVRPVDADRDGSMLAAAVKDHAYNWDVHASALQFTFRDDRVPYEWTMSADTFSPHTFVKDLDASGAAVYGVSGWFDGGYPHAAIKRHLTLTGKKNRLILGPWDHGGDNNCGPYVGEPTRFDMRVELFRFFEHHLRGTDTGIQNDKPIHYYTMGQEKWKSADAWPPPATPRAFYLGPNAKLIADKPSAPDASDACTVDYTHGTGGHARWNCLLIGGPVVYPDRKARDKKLLCYETEPLTQDTEVTGHPIVTLHVTSSAKDGNFFVYLEDVDEKGNVHYVTEGLLRAVHRKLSSAEPPYKQVVPYRTFRRADAMFLKPNEVAELTFDVLPVSHLFRAGHRIRIAIAGADVDHFPNPPGRPPTIKIHRSSAHPSRIVLPIVSQPSE